MRPHIQLKLHCNYRVAAKRFARYSSLFVAMFLCLFSWTKILALPPDKIQQTVDAIKQAYYCEDADYHTDGQRTVWVKSYKKWLPEDWATVQKEAPHVLKFLNQAIDHNRPDIIVQLMPDYYHAHGGVVAFERDIQKRK